MWVASIVGLAVVVVLTGRWSGSWSNLAAGLAEPLRFGPAILVMLTMLVGGCLHQPTMLDSLTYRLVQILIWLQDGHIHHIMSGDDRLNYMPQTWGICTMPLVQLAGDHLVWLWGVFSWVVLYLFAYDLALNVSKEVKKSRVMAFIGSTTSFAVLQGESSANDLFAGVMMLMALRSVMAFERTRDRWEIHWAVLSFCLAAGTKPHFSVFGLPLTLWFLFAPSRPWRAFCWSWLPVLLPIWLLCSPVPSFVLNYETYGSLAGPGQDYSMKGKGPMTNIPLGSAMIVWQSVQPPVNPAAPLFNRWFNRIIDLSKLKQSVPRFQLRASPLCSVDGASLGLLASVLFAAGVILALKRVPGTWRSWQMLAMAAGLLCILLALSRFVSGASGRAYCGFLYFALPLAIVGWNSLRPGTLKLSWSLCLLNAMFLLVFNPERPLWPVKWVDRKLDDFPRLSWLGSLDQALEPYYKFSERATTGEELVRILPVGEVEIVVLAGEDRPLLPLFRPYFSGRKLVFLPRHSKPEKLNAVAANYVIVGGAAAEMYPELCDYLEKSGDFTLVLSRDYVSKLARGPETWKLYRRVGAPDK
jgi:hypothetical protein